MTGRASVRRRIDSWLAAALGCGVLAALPLLIGPGIVNTRAGGDSPFLLLRVYEMFCSLRAGNFPVRWMPDAAFGLGYPAFLYYAALPYYIASALSLAGFGVIWGIKLTQAFGFVAAAGATYGLARQWGRKPSSALLASAVYSMAPFHLANVYVRGDSLSEFWAMALFPLVLWAQDRACERRTTQAIVAFSASYATLVLCHNISAMLFTPFVLAAMLLRLHRPWRQTLRGILPAWLAGMALGLALSAWFWLPAMAEQGLVQLQDQTTGYFHYSGHFLDAHLVQWRPIHDYAVGEGLYPFSMGMLQAVVALLGLGVVVGRAIGRAPHPQGDDWAVVALIVTTVLMTSVSTILWRTLPLLPLAQFPWRLLSIQSLAVALLASSVCERVRSPIQAAVSLCGCALAVITGLGALQVDRFTISEGDVTARRLMLYEVYSGNIGGTIRSEYLPRSMMPRPYTSAVLLSGGERAEPLVLEGQVASFVSEEAKGDSETWKIAVTQPALLAFHRTWFPGWTATVDGVAAEAEAIDGLGLVGLRLDPGVHRVSLAFGSTPFRRAFGAVSAGALALVVAAIARWCVTSRRARRAMATSLGAALAILALGLVSRTSISEMETDGPLLMDTARAPYLHHEPEPVSLGSVELLGYDLRDTRACPGCSVDVVLRWGGEWLGHTVRLVLVGATAHQFDDAPIWSEAEGDITSTETAVSLPVPADAPPGLYAVRVRVFKDGKDQALRTASGLKLSKLAVEPIQVTGAPRATGDEPVLAGYGPPDAAPVIALVSAKAAMLPGKGAVEARLAWRSERQASLNYMLSLRLLDAAGAVIAARDVPPTLGGYPTSLWVPGEIVSDRVVLPMPQGATPSEARTLDVVLYDRSTLQAAGTGRISVGAMQIAAGD